LRPHHIVTIPCDTPVIKAFSLLLDEDLLSAPVEDGKGGFVGVLELADLVGFILAEYRESKDELALGGGKSFDSIQNLLEVFGQGEEARSQGGGTGSAVEEKLAVDLARVSSEVKGASRFTKSANKVKSAVHKKHLVGKALGSFQHRQKG